jgi:ABC-type Fe3+ transport system permease subunit
MALAGLQGLNTSAIEAAQIDGATPWQITRYIKLRMLAPILMITLLMRLIDALRGLEVVYALTNGGPGLSTELFPLHIYKSAFVTQRMGHSAALSICLVLVTTALSVALLTRSNPLARRGEWYDNPRKHRLDRALHRRRDYGHACADAAGRDVGNVIEDTTADFRQRLYGSVYANAAELS